MTKVRAHRGHPEDDLQGQLVALHRALVPPAAAILIAVPNGEERSPIVAARLSGINSKRRAEMSEEQALQPYGQGVLPGVSDLVWILPGPRTVWIEVKIPKITFPPAHLPSAGPRKVLHAAGVQSKEQKRFQAGIAAMGHRYHLVRSADDYLDLLEEYGVPLRGPRPWGPGFAARPPA